MKLGSLALMALLLGLGCSTKPKPTVELREITPPAETAPPAAEVPKPVPATPAPHVAETMLASNGQSSRQDEMTVRLKDSKGQSISAPAPKNMVGTDTNDKLVTSVDSTLPVPSTRPAPGILERGPIPAETALGWLKNGNTRYVKQRLRADGQGKYDILRVSVVQQPHSLILGPSDSRIPPELIFDQKLGEITVIRMPTPMNADHVRGGIENTVRDLGIRLIVFLNTEGTKEALLASSEYLKTRSQDDLRMVDASYDLVTGEVRFK